MGMLESFPCGSKTLHVKKLGLQRERVRMCMCVRACVCVCTRAFVVIHHVCM
jgi:hypothetical protein